MNTESTTTSEAPALLKPGKRAAPNKGVKWKPAQKAKLRKTLAAKKAAKLAAAGSGAGFLPLDLIPKGPRPYSKRKVATAKTGSNELELAKLGLATALMEAIGKLLK